MNWIRGFVVAGKGIATAWKEQRNLKIHSFITVAVLLLGWYAGLSLAEWCVVVLACGLVISMELINTAIENLTDLVMKEQHPVAGKVKDIAAGAVLIVSMAACLAGILIFGRHFWDLL